MSTTRINTHIRAPRSAVYRALVDSAAVQQWMVPDSMTSVVHDFAAREGGAFRISLTYDDALPDAHGKSGARTDTYHGRFVRLITDERVVETMAFETDDPAMQGEMTITFILIDAFGETELYATHQGVPRGVPEADNALGWKLSLGKLAALVEAGAE